LLGILKEGTILTNQLNKEYKTFVKKYGDVESELEIEFEKVFEKVLYVCRKNDITKGAKKNYAYKILWEDGQLGDGTIKVKGMSSRRSDTPKIAKEVQKKVINMIMNEKNKETIVEYLRDIDKQIRTGKIPSEDIAFPKGISNELSEYGKTITNEKTGTTYQTGTPPVIRGAKYANKYLNQQFGKGDKPKWLYIKQSPPHFPDTDVLTFQNEFPEGFIVDLEKMRDKLFRDKLEPLFISAGFGAMPIINSAVKTLNEYR
jgi:DNA polymerase elongation subunit (family B)